MTSAAMPCDPWDVILPCKLTGVSATITGAAVEVATEIMWALSGRQFGTCTVTLRPCRDECDPAYNYISGSSFFDTYWPHPALIRGLWYNLGCDGGCTSDCSCNTVSQFTIPRPVVSIENITIDGSVLATGSYRVDDHRKVVRTDGGVWPFCNDISINSGPGAWSVTATIGVEVPAGGLMAAGELACEIIKSCQNDKDCKLPRRMQTLTRQGVTVGFVDPMEYLNDGKTGLYLPDLWLQSVNPNRLMAPSRVYSPDVPVPRVRTF